MVLRRYQTRNGRHRFFFHGKQKHIGSFNTEVEAAKAYDEVAKELSNKRLNFPGDYPEHCEHKFFASRVDYVESEVEAALQIIAKSMKPKRKARHGVLKGKNNT